MFSIWRSVFLFFLLQSTLAVGSDELTPYTSQGNLADGPILPSLWYFEDASRELTLAQAQARFHNGEFLPETANLNFGYNDSAFWVVFMVNVPRSTMRERLREVVIELDYPHLDHIEFNKLTSDGSLLKHLKLGDSEPFISRELNSSLFAIPDTLIPGITYQYWIRIETTSSMQLNPSIWDKDRYLESRSHIQMAYGFFFGILVIMAIYNLFIGFSTRDISYFYYVGYIASFCLLQACLWGYAYQYLWPTLPFMNDYAIPVSILSALICAGMFTKSFLQTQTHSPTHNKLLTALCIAGGVLLVINLFIPYEVRVRLAVWLSLLFTVILLHAAAAVAQKGQQSAKLFLWAWSTMLVGAVIYGFAALGFLPSNLLTRHAAQIGSALEVVLLSFALAYRINRMKAEKRAVEARAKRALESKNLELQHALRQITKSNSLKDEFLATISHELRTPMNGIEGSLHMVRHNLPEGSDQRHINAAFYSAHHMTQLVESLLEYSELQSGNWKLNEQPFNLEQLVDKLTENLQKEYVSSDLEFHLDKDIQLHHRVVGDADRLNHLLFQLLDNAFKFTHEGSVKLRVNAQENADSCAIEFEVTDTGIGMRPDQLKTIFEGFRQVDGSFSRQYGGLGIGLSICKAITDSMQGSISIETSPNQGSRFRVVLSLRKADPIEQPKPQLQHLPGSPRVLVVEDNPVNQLTLIAMVKKLGCQVSKAGNGEEAVRLCHQEHFDIILMDCQMPIMDGFEATRIIRQPGNLNSEVPIIAVTANVMSGDRERCLSAGMNDYVKKPIKMNVIRERLFHWLADKAA